MATDQEGQAGEYELSPSGNPILRHAERKIPFQLAVGDSENIGRITEHIEKHLGPVESVFHEILSDLVHIDLHLVAPTPERNCYTLVTSGMSDAPMTVPEGLEAMRFAELMIQLPPDWPLDKVQALPGKPPEKGDAERAATERWYWPLRWLKVMARLPHEYDTWLCESHTVPNGDPPEPFAPDTKLCGMLVIPPMGASVDFAMLNVNPDKTIFFYQLMPIYAEEMDLKLRKGVDALMKRFDQDKVGVVVNPSRPNVGGRKKWLGLL
jgi:hypothetical protein